MSYALRQRLFEELDAIVLIDPHTHINAHQPASQTLADVLGYHYYTELAHSAGMRREWIEQPGLSPKEKVGRLVEGLGPIENTIQYSWLIEMLREFFDFKDERLTKDNWEAAYDTAAAKMQSSDWAGQVLEKSRLEAVFLTNDFDDPLVNIDTHVYVPCLRTDDLVFHLAKPAVRERLEGASQVALRDAMSLRNAIGHLFERFTAKNCRACAISLPPDFSPNRVDPVEADTALAAPLAGGSLDVHHQRALSNYVFWSLAEFCMDFKLPFDLMIGVNRAVYPGGVYQGQDLYDSRVSLIQYRELFNAFPQVTFPISVLASVTNQELTSYAWIFPNVVCNGHWWYTNTPTLYRARLPPARLEAVPRTKQIGYYSDMYKLEFALPKFRMYKRILAKVLAERFVSTEAGVRSG